jgi:hypothetical protein
MQKFRIGDKIKITHKGKEDEHLYTILDILEDYDGSAYWLRNEKGVPLLEAETRETEFEKVITTEA